MLEWLSKMFGNQAASEAGGAAGQEVMGQAAAQGAGIGTGTATSASTTALQQEQLALANADPWWESELKGMAKSGARQQLMGPGPQGGSFGAPQVNQPTRRAYNEPIGRGKVTPMPASAYNTLGQRFDLNQRFF